MRRTRAGASPRKIRGGKVKPKLKPRITQKPKPPIARAPADKKFWKAGKPVKPPKPKLKPRIVNKPPSTKVHGAPVGKFERAPKMRKPPVARKPVATAGVKLKAKKTRGGVSKRRMTQSRRKTR